jgi:peptide/nickel transport system permease protein
MLRFIARRLALAIPTLIIASMIIFALQQLLPGDAATALSGEDSDPQSIAFIRAKYHLDQPLPVRYMYWADGVIHGDLGQSIRLQQPVFDLVRQKLPVTLELACLAMILALMIGVPMGIISAVKRGTWADALANGVALWGLSVPNFWLGILMILLFSVQLGWLPASGFTPMSESLTENLRSLAMPAFVLGNAIAAVMMRHTRAAMLGVLGSDYIRTARAKGVPSLRIILRHALPNAAIPIVTLAALEFGQLLSGAVLTEQVFSVPGFGKLMVDAVFNRDYATVQGVVICTATAYVLLNLGADVLAAVFNPKLRHA